MQQLIVSRFRSCDKALIACTAFAAISVSTLWRTEMTSPKPKARLLDNLHLGVAVRLPRGQVTCVRAVLATVGLPVLYDGTDGIAMSRDKNSFRIGLRSASSL